MVLQFPCQPVDKIITMRLLRSALLILAILLLGGATNAFGQTTQPSETWSDVMGRLSDALRGSNVDVLNAILDHGPVIRTFSSDTLQSSDRLIGAANGCKQIGLHAYLKLPTSLATDLADDFKAADVPDSVRHDMLITDASAERPANDIAARWVSQILQPAGDQAVGVIVCWRKDKSDNFSSLDASRPTFFLVKADLVDNKYVFRQVVFGDPLEKKR